MPTYDYECTACGHRFEKFQPITASSIRKCPECKKLKVKRLLGTGAGIIFKGSGFYQTDYRSDSYKKAAEKDKSSAAEKDKPGAGEKDKPSEKAKGSGEEAKSSGDKKADSGGSS